MKKSMMAVVVVAVSVLAARAESPAQIHTDSGSSGEFALSASNTSDPVQKAVKTYFDTIFGRLKEVADKKPNVDTFRDCMKPLADKTEGLYGGTFIDTDFVIRQVYFPSHFLARGFDLKKVKELDYFWAQMRKTPAPQVSEPGHGSLVQPRLIAMRYPVVSDGKLQSVVSIMVRTESFLAAVGLDGCKGYRITCRGVVAEVGGDLTGVPKSFSISLPANEWKVEYRK